MIFSWSNILDNLAWLSDCWKHLSGVFWNKDSLHKSWKFKGYACLSANKKGLRKHKLWCLLDLLQSLLNSPFVILYSLPLLQKLSMFCRVLWTLAIVKTFFICASIHSNEKRKTKYQKTRTPPPPKKKTAFDDIFTIGHVIIWHSGSNWIVNSKPNKNIFYRIK